MGLLHKNYLSVKLRLDTFGIYCLIAVRTRIQVWTFCFSEKIKVALRRVHLKKNWVIRESTYSILQRLNPSILLQKRRGYKAVVAYVFLLDFRGLVGQAELGVAGEFLVTHGGGEFAISRALSKYCLLMIS